MYYLAAWKKMNLIKFICDLIECRDLEYLYKLRVWPYREVIYLSIYRIYIIL